jgi:transposase-like protein
MFQPPRCPNRLCRQHRRPEPRFYTRRGFYHPRCRAHPVPRFRCRTCGKGFSRQTFRLDYRDHRPDLNAKLFVAIATATGLRQTARNIGLSYKSTRRKFRKLARHLFRLNLNVRAPLAEGSILMLDELETFEGRRNTRPLTLPVLIEKETRFVIWSESAPIRPRGKMSKARKKAIAADERRYGPRRDRSHCAVRRTLRRGAELTSELEVVELHTDEKSTYPAAARKAFGSERLVHRTTNSKLARGTWNPLFAINHTEAMARDLLGRLRRESWLVSKRGRFLDLAIQMWMAHRNFVRRRYNRDKESPAQMLGFLDRRMRPEQLLTWRQDWRRQSIHPLSRNETSVGVWMARRHAA